MAAVAVYGGHDLGQIFVLDGALDRVLAVGGGAPLQVLSVVDVGACEEDLVSGVISFMFQPSKSGMLTATGGLV
jgi:hypothetical protein